MQGEYSKHRKEMVEEINRGSCVCCGDSFSQIHIHHLDGNHNNNERINLIELCRKCHILVHKGFSKRVLFEEFIRERILKVRSILLIKFYNYSLEDVRDRIKYERAVCSHIGLYKKKCSICNSRTNLKLFTPNFVFKFDKENIRGIGVAICGKCSKNQENVKDLNFISLISTTFINDK